MRSTMPDYPLTLHHFLWRATALFAKKEIVTRREQGMHRYTYRDFGKRVAQLAHVLRDLGVRPGDRVATCAWNTYRHLELYFAVPCVGAVLHTLNPRLFAEHLQYIVNDAEDRVIFVDASLVPVLARLAGNLPSVQHFVCLADGTIPESPLTAMASYEDLLRDKPTTFDWPAVDELDAAAMCYTSGTTGKPKGVVYSHRSTVLHTFGAAVGDCIGLTEKDCLLPVVPMFHANAWGQPYAATMLGAKQVFPDRFLDPASLVGLIQGEGVTVTAGVPTIWIGLLQYLEKTGTRLPTVRSVVCGGSAIPPALMEGMAKHGLTMLHAWGMTETSPLGSVSFVKSYLGKTRDEELKIRLKQGLPSAGVEARVVSLDNGRELAWDGQTIGELQVRGSWVTAGYYRGVDADRFTQDGWLRTGDVVTIDPEGYIQIADRVKDLVKSAGEWISSVELESAIMGHPKVLEAAVVGIPHPKWQERPIAFVVPKAEHKGTLTAQEILSFLDGKVAKWWLPDEVRFVVEIPKTSVGKFDKKVLRETAAKDAVAITPSE